MTHYIEFSKEMNIIRFIEDAYKINSPCLEDNPYKGCDSID